MVDNLVDTLFTYVFCVSSFFTQMNSRANIAGEAALRAFDDLRIDAVAVVGLTRMASIFHHLSEK